MGEGGMRVGRGWKRFGRGWERVWRGWERVGRGWESVGRRCGRGSERVWRGWETVRRGLGEGGRGLGEGGRGFGDGGRRFGRGCERFGFRFQVDPPEAPAQLEGDPENDGLPTAIGRLTRSRPVGSKRAARGSTPRHRGLTLAGFRGGGGSAFGVGGAVGVYLRCGGGVLGVPAESGSVRRQRARHAGVHEAPPLHALPHLVSPKEKGPSGVA